MDTLIRIEEAILTDGSSVFNIILVNSTNKIKLACDSKKQAHLLFENISKYCVNVVEVS